MRIVFWQDILSCHQSAYIRALSNKKNCKVLLIAQEDISTRRKNMGWSIPDFGKTEIIIQPNKIQISQILADAENDSVHIFSGINAYPLIKNALSQSLSYNISRGILSESLELRGVKGIVRLGLGKLNAIRFHNKIDFVLAISSLAVDCFQKCGFPKNKIFPFGYFVESFDKSECDNRKSYKYKKDKYHLIFIGQCIKRKGIDILLQALSCLKETNWCLDVIGDGRDRNYFEALSEKLKLTEYVKFNGVLPNKEAIIFLKSADLLILPSRWDGWGAVINESLMSGIPVICSDKCGAKDLLRDSFRGNVFKSGSVSNLCNILTRYVSQDKRTSKLTSKIKKWSMAIEGEIVANYLLEVIDASLNKKQKPIPPWQK